FHETRTIISSHRIELVFVIKSFIDVLCTWILQDSIANRKLSSQSTAIPLDRFQYVVFLVSRETIQILSWACHLMDISCHDRSLLRPTRRVFSYPPQFARVKSVG